MLWAKSIPEQEWRALSQSIALLHCYRTEDLHRLKRLTERFLASKAIDGAGGFEVSQVVARTIAAQACAPILRLGLGKLHWLVLGHRLSRRFSRLARVCR